MILDKIIAHKKLEVDAQRLHTSLDEIERNLAGLDAVRGFKEAISVHGKVNLIAEIKKASPSRGVIRSDFDPEIIARTYEENGAAAISVLTDKEFFQGDLSFLSRVRSVTSSVPILHTDQFGGEHHLLIQRTGFRPVADNPIEASRSFAVHMQHVQINPVQSDQRVLFVLDSCPPRQQRNRNGGRFRRRAAPFRSPGLSTRPFGCRLAQALPRPRPQPRAALAEAAAIARERRELQAGPNESN